MRYTIAHQGVPVGTAELELGPNVIAAPVALLPAYDVVRPLVRAATEALLELGFPGPGGASDISSAREVALGRAVKLGRSLELRDDQGALVAADFVELMDGVSPEAEVIVWVRAHHAPAGVPARRSSPQPSAQDGSRTEA